MVGKRAVRFLVFTNILAARLPTLHQMEVTPINLGFKQIPKPKFINLADFF